jgi:ubiquinone/menaquinone biosynthesis C-methylase UbiE
MSQPWGGFAAKKVKSYFNINPIIRLFDSPKTARDKVAYYVSEGQRAADIACESGYYTLLLADCVGPEGRVYSVDLNPEAIKQVDAKISQSGFHNVELHNANAADLNFIEDHTIDFVLANGLL